MIMYTLKENCRYTGNCKNKTTFDDFIECLAAKNQSNVYVQKNY